MSPSTGIIMANMGDGERQQGDPDAKVILGQLREALGPKVAEEYRECLRNFTLSDTLSKAEFDAKARALLGEENGMPVWAWGRVYAGGWVCMCVCLHAWTVWCRSVHRCALTETLPRLFLIHGERRSQLGEEIGIPCRVRAGLG